MPSSRSGRRDSMGHAAYDMDVPAEALDQRLTAAFGPALGISDPETREIGRVWTIGQVEVAVANPVPERRFRALWKKRQGGRPTPLLVVSEASDGRILVLGPQDDASPIRSVDPGTFVSLLHDAEGLSRRQASATLAAGLERLDAGAGIRGIVLRGLLTKHLLTRRLKRNRPTDWERLQVTAKTLRKGRNWTENFTALGYRV